MLARPLIGLFVGAIVSGGCVGDVTTGDDGAEPFRRASDLVAGRNGTVFDPDWASVPYGPPHNHRDPSHHKNLSTPNFEILGYEPLKTDWHGKTPGGFGCADSREKDGRRLSITNSYNTDVALIITDVTDASRPQKLGELVLPSTHVNDDAITPDMRYVLLSTDPFESGPEDPTAVPLHQSPFFRDECSGEIVPVRGPEQGLPYAAGLILIDIDNPRAPIIVDFRAFAPLGVHSIRAFEIDGELLLAASVVGAPNGAAGYYALMDIIETPEGAKLNLISVLYPPSRYAEGAERMQSWSTHDVFIQRHPATGALLLYLADVYHGMWIANIQDPSSPEFIGRWESAPAFGRDILVHGVTPTPILWEGRHYTFVGEECFGPFEDTPTCVIATLDTTDPTNPKLLSAWTVPVVLEWEHELIFTLHYADLLGRTLLVSNNHGGAWAIDVSTPAALKTMPAIGKFVPSNDPPGGIVGKTNTQDTSEYHHSRPVVWDFGVFADGTIAIYDMNSGLYMLRFDAANPAPAPEPWPMAHVKLDAEG